MYGWPSYRLDACVARLHICAHQVLRFPEIIRTLAVVCTVPCSFPYQRSTQATLSAVDVDEVRAGERRSEMSLGRSEVTRRRTATQFDPRTKIYTTPTTKSNSAQSTGTSVATIVLEDEDDEDVTSRGSENSSRPSMGVEDPAVIISPLPAFRSSVVVDDGRNSMYAEVCQAPTLSWVFSLI